MQYQSTSAVDDLDSSALFPQHEVGDAVTDWLQTFRLTDTDDAVVCYLAGYAMTKVSRMLKCCQCSLAYNTSNTRSQITRPALLIQRFSAVFHTA